jgi:nucleoside-diphosphate-sugar epimerase
VPFPSSVGITGANGRVGRVLVDGLKDACDVRAFSRREVDFPTTVVDLHNLEAATHAFEGLDALIHLAADPSPGSGWDSVLENNIDMTYQVYEGCRIAGVRRVVFASTNHTSTETRFSPLPKRWTPPRTPR